MLYRHHLNLAAIRSIHLFYYTAAYGDGSETRYVRRLGYGRGIYPFKYLCKLAASQLCDGMLDLGPSFNKEEVILTPISLRLIVKSLSTSSFLSTILFHILKLIFSVILSPN